LSRWESGLRWGGRDRGPLDERWYKNGLIYEVSVRAFLDSNGDGFGDLRGLASKLDYLAGLGVTCLWLLPFYPSPWRDDGYDVTDHAAVHPSAGSLPEAVQLIHAAGDRGIRVIVDLVFNHTSDEHPWFQAARRGDPRYRDYYVWADRRPEDADSGVVFPGSQTTTWSYDRAARRWYFHRFYDFEPDLNIDNPEVREDLGRIMAFWLELGVAGFRMDAVPFVIEPVSAQDSHPDPRFDYLHEFRNLLSWRRGDAVLLGEANVERDAIEDYYGVGGMHMLFNFPANQHLWLALARGDATVLVNALEQTAGIPATDQWANFVRNHDEIDLGRLSEDERADVFRRFGPRPTMQLYGRGLRRRMAPMLGGDHRRLELALSLMLALPGTPVLYYGDEIGMGEDLGQPERNSVRTAMQWSAGPGAGFSSIPARARQVPVVTRGTFSSRRVNVADQQRDQGSLLNWFIRANRVRRECPEIGLVSWRAVPTGDPAILGLEYRGSTRTVTVVHNLGPERKALRQRVGAGRPEALLMDGRSSLSEGGRLELDGYGYCWLAGPVS
jgi:maltose alpha-D-glucosyltransferase / alpha-amylase